MLSIEEKQLEMLLSSQKATMSRIRELKKEHPGLESGYNISFGGILNAYRECDLTFAECVVKLKAISHKDSSAKAYSYFLFGQLWLEIYPENCDLEYDLAFELILNSHRDYTASIYNDPNLGEYQCISDYLENEREN